MNSITKTQQEALAQLIGGMLFSAFCASEKGRKQIINAHSPLIWRTACMKITSVHILTLWRRGSTQQACLKRVLGTDFESLSVGCTTELHIFVPVNYVWKREIRDFGLVEARGTAGRETTPRPSGRSQTGEKHKRSLECRAGSSVGVRGGTGLRAHFTRADPARSRCSPLLSVFLARCVSRWRYWSLVWRLVIVNGERAGLEIVRGERALCAPTMHAPTLLGRRSRLLDDGRASTLSPDRCRDLLRRCSQRNNRRGVPCRPKEYNE